MNLDQHDYIIIAIILGIILLQFIVFASNMRKISNYKKTIQKAQDFEIVEVEVPEDWIKELEVIEILNDPDGFRKSSSKYLNENELKQEENTKRDFGVQVEKIEKGMQYDEENISLQNGNTIGGTDPEKLNFPEEEVEQEYEVEEFEEDDFIFEEEKDSKSK